MNLLDRYIFKSVLFTCLGAMALFTFVLTLGNVLKDLLGYVLAGQIPLGPFLQLVWLWVPAMAIYALPIGILTGVLLTLGRLSADSEITAMRAAGISLARLARPVFALGALCAALAFYINFESMPHARQRYEKDLAAIVRADPLRFIVPKTFITRFPGFVLYVGEKQGTVLQDIWLSELDSERRVKRRVHADSGRLNYDEATNSFVPTLVHARMVELDPKDPEDFSKSPRVASVEKTEELRLPLDRFFRSSNVRIKQDWLTYAQLRLEQAKLAAQPPPLPAEAKQRARAEMAFKLVLHDKLNLSLAVLTFALIGVPLGIKVSRRETSANLGIALFLVLGYYVLSVMVKWLDRHPEYRPDLLLWVPNLLFLGVAFWLFRRIERA